MLVQVIAYLHYTQEVLLASLLVVAAPSVVAA
jgi:hypothetical protein